MIASGKPDDSLACVIRSEYGLLSTNCSGSIEITSASSSSNLPSSKSSLSRSRAPMRKWWPQCLHTCRPSSSSPVKICASHPSHLTKTFSVFTTRSSGGTASMRLLFLLNQAIGMQRRVAQRGSEFDPLLRANARGERMLDLSHLGHKVRGFD